MKNTQIRQIVENVFRLVKTSAKLMLTADLISTDPHTVSHGALILADGRYRNLRLLVVFVWM